MESPYDKDFIPHDSFIQSRFLECYSVAGPEAGCFSHPGACECCPRLVQGTASLALREFLLWVQERTRETRPFALKELTLEWGKTGDNTQKARSNKESLT